MKLFPPKQFPMFTFFEQLIKKIKQGSRAIS